MQALIDQAIAMRSRAQAPYSHYAVGAAVLTEEGTIIGGCNVESSSYGLTCCAERIAIYNALTAGHKRFTALAVATENGAPPCGACRQVIWERCGDIPVYLTDKDGNFTTTTSKALFPEPFDQTNLK